MTKRVVVIAVQHPEHPNMYLHLLRSDNGLWACPGGHMIPGETPAEAARRELSEETGVDVDQLSSLKNGEYPDEGGGRIQVHLFGASLNPTTFTAKNDPDKEAVTFRYLDPTECDSLHVPGRRNILLQHLGELQKGVMSRVAPFNPRKDIEQELNTDLYDIRDWQDYNPTAEWMPDDPDAPEPSKRQMMSEYRDRIEPMEPHVRARALHRLSGLTEVRKNPLTGEREFLLHRGMSPKEHSESISRGHVDHDHRTSWTPDRSKAKEFTVQSMISEAGEGSPGPGKGQVVSAWIPEGKIVHMPMMYGKIGDAGAGLGRNPYHTELETIVEAGHNAEVHNQDPSSQPSIHAKISERRPREILDTQGANEAYWKAAKNAIAHLHPDEQKKIMDKMSAQAGMKPPAKLAASERDLRFLLKGLKGDWRKEGYGFRYHAPKDKSGPYALHSVTAHDQLGRTVGSLQAEDLGDGTFQAHIVEVHPIHQRKGLATHMYRQMEQQTGLKAAPDLEAQTPQGAALWRQKKRPFGKSEGLEKGRPRLTFDKLGVGTQDHQISIVQTPRQKKIRTLAIANEMLPGTPGENRMQSVAGRRISRLDKPSQEAGSVTLAVRPESTRSNKAFGVAWAGRYHKTRGEQDEHGLTPQKQLNATVQHEGNHMVFHQLASALGGHDQKAKVLKKLVNHALPDAHDHNTLFAYTRTIGYNPLKTLSSGRFHEEMINAIQDILTDPTQRKHFEDWYYKTNAAKPGFVGTQNMTNRLKRGWGRLVQAAKLVDREFAKREMMKSVDAEYKNRANRLYTVLVPVSLGGKHELAPGIPFHITVKQFDPERDSIDRVNKELGRFDNLPKPHPKQLRLEPGSFVSPKTGQTSYHLKVHGMPKEYGELYDHFRDFGVTYPTYSPHITIPKEMHDDITSGKLPLDSIELEIHNPVLRSGQHQIKEWGQKP